MKKIFALVLATLMLFSATGAFSEEETAAEIIDIEGENEVPAEASSQEENTPSEEKVRFHCTAIARVQRGKIYEGNPVVLYLEVDHVNMSYSVIWQSLDKTMYALDDAGGWRFCNAGNMLFLTASAECNTLAYRGLLTGVDGTVIASEPVSFTVSERPAENGETENEAAEEAIDAEPEAEEAAEEVIEAEPEEKEAAEEVIDAEPEEEEADEEAIDAEPEDEAAEAESETEDAQIDEPVPEETNAEETGLEAVDDETEAEETEIVEAIEQETIETEPAQPQTEAPAVETEVTSGEPEAEQQEAEQSGFGELEAEQQEAEQSGFGEPEAEPQETEQPEAGESEAEQQADGEPEAEQPEDVLSENEQPEAEQSEAEQTEAEQPEAGEPEDEQREDEQPEAEGETAEENASQTIYTYLKDENGSLILDEDGKPIVSIEGEGEIPAAYALDEEDNYILDENGDPIPTQYVPADAVRTMTLEDALDPDRTIDIYISWNGEKADIGLSATFIAVLNGYDNLIYTVRWQQSADCADWRYVGEQTTNEAESFRLNVEITRENYTDYWRVEVSITDFIKP